MNQKIIDMNNLHAAKTALWAWQPTALYIHLADKCPSCKRLGGFISYQLHDDLDVIRPTDEEQCAYFCRYCEFTAAGSRKVKP